MEAAEYIDSQAREFFAQLKEWLAIPSISADPARHDDVRASAEWLAAHLSGTGFPVVEIWETGGAWRAGRAGGVRALARGRPGRADRAGLRAPRRAAGRAAGEWDSPPFEPVERDGQLLGRGASDDKGQVLLHTLGLRACLAAGRPAGAAGVAQVPDRGGGGVRLAALRRAAAPPGGRSAAT